MITELSNFQFVKGVWIESIVFQIFPRQFEQILLLKNTWLRWLMTFNLRIWIFATPQLLNMENIFTDAEPFLNFLLCLGFYPNVLVRPARKGNFKLTCYSISLSFLMSLLVGTLIFLNFHVSGAYKIISTNIAFKALKIVKIVELLSCLAILCFQIFNRENVVKFLVMINKIDESVRQRIKLSDPFGSLIYFLYFWQIKLVNIIINHKRHRTVVRILIFAQLFVAVNITLHIPLVHYFHGELSNMKSFEMLSLGLVNLLRLVFSTQFILAAVTVRVRFAAFNKSLLNTISGKKYQIVKTEYVLTTKLRKIYLDLCDCIALVNETFTVQLIYIFTTAMVNILWIKWACIDF